MKVWKLKKGHDIRLRTRHPWVFSNELLDSPKSIKAGEPVEVHDYNGNFLARGYGNPHSLISFRAVSFSRLDEQPMSPEFLALRLVQAWVFRNQCGFEKSFRLCFSEADQLPGLILDRYTCMNEGKLFQVFSYQLLTAGFDLVFNSKKGHWEEILKKLVDESVRLGLSRIEWAQTMVLQRNDVNVRKLEGLAIEEPVILKQCEDTVAVDLTDTLVIMQGALPDSGDVYFQVNLAQGQKTGFFLDQSLNMRLLLQQLKVQLKIQQLNSAGLNLQNRPVRILDLCCYMGQWSAQIVAQLKAWGVQAEVHLVDISELALKHAQQNLMNFSDSKFQVGIRTSVIDVLKLEQLFTSGEDLYDVVISDPPAFVKNKKDLPQGLHAYFKLNAQAFKVCAPGGLVVSCTCSGAVGWDDFKEALRKSIVRSGKNARCLLQGGQGLDHPTLMSFPEGHYLKMALHRVN